MTLPAWMTAEKAAAAAAPPPPQASYGSYSNGGGYDDGRYANSSYDPYAATAAPHSHHHHHSPPPMAPSPHVMSAPPVSQPPRRSHSPDAHRSRHRSRSPLSVDSSEYLLFSDRETKTEATTAAAGDPLKEAQVAEIETDLAPKRRGEIAQLLRMAKESGGFREEKESHQTLTCVLRMDKSFPQLWVLDPI